MPIKPVCDKCGRELDEFGAILMGPPDKKGRVKKFHICTRCYRLIMESII
jgi:hypothetical protein